MQERDESRLVVASRTGVDWRVKRFFRSLNLLSWGEGYRSSAGAARMTQRSKAASDV
jgi:hypothetical protein